MKERKNRTKKIRGVKKVSINLLSLTFSMIKSFPIALLADHTQKIADKGWRCGQEEVREDKLAVLTLSIFGLFRTRGRRFHCYVRSRKDVASYVIMNVEALVVLSWSVLRNTIRS
jgi:hypothetical protein